MDQKREAKLSSIITALACAYTGWVAYVLITRVPPLSKSLVSLGSQIPRPTAFVIATSNPAIALPIMLLLVGLLIAKEFLMVDFGRRVAITVIVFMAISWFRDFAIDAMQRPLLQLIEQLNS
jgi:hypothetical protein